MKNKQQPPLPLELLAQFGGCQGVFRWKDSNHEDYIGKIRLAQWLETSVLKIDLKWLIPISSTHSRNLQPQLLYPTRKGILNYEIVFENQKYAIEDGRIGFLNRDPNIVEVVYISTRGEDIFFTESIHEKARRLGFLPKH